MTHENEKRTIKISRRDLVSGPYKQCPNSKCRAENSFGVQVCIEGLSNYTRECIKCGYQKTYNLPNINKKIIYLDQFVISNLVKLLDKTHPSHQKIASDPFWESLFIKLEMASKAQAIICPDSFYHLDESLIGNIDFKLMKRLYEHFSNGKTLYPSSVVCRIQVAVHFKGWLKNEKVNFEFNPENLSFGNLHTWSIGLMVSVGGNPYSGQIEGIQKMNTLTKNQLKEIWTRWQNEKISFLDRIKEETLGFGKSLLSVAQQFAKKQEIIVMKIASGQKYNIELDDLFPPLSDDILEELFRIAKEYGLSKNQIPVVVAKYLSDVDALLEIPQIRINSIMFAGLAHRAASGKKNAPKSTVDVQVISSYLPYCDALFVDKESAALLKEFPKNTPNHLRLKEFTSKIFSLGNKNEFLNYLNQLVAEIPEDQMNLLKDIEGENYTKPYWNIIEYEKKKLGI